jgi:GT2 family glycosyltransferase
MAHSMPHISVIVALDAFNPFLPEGGRPYLQQTASPHDYEVIVVDWAEGPSQAALIARLQAEAPEGLRITYLRHPSFSRAALNNLGVRHASAPLICFAADDAAPAPTFVASHLAFHRAHPEPHRAAFGAFRSPDHQRAASPLLTWLENAGEFAGFSLREPHDQHPAAFFNAANTSVKSAFLLEAGEFDERLPFPAQDDADMGQRMGKLGLTSTFIAGAEATHDHLLFLPERSDQIARGGYCQALLDSQLVPRPLQPGLIVWAIAKALYRLLRFCSRQGWDTQGLRWKLSLSVAGLQGYWHFLTAPDDLDRLTRGLQRASPAELALTN